MADQNARWTPQQYTVNEKGKVVGYVNRDVNNWGKWGDDDEKGAVNYITPEKIMEAAKLIKTGKVFSLMVGIDRSAPLLRGAFEHYFTMNAAETVLRTRCCPRGYRLTMIHSCCRRISPPIGIPWHTLHTMI